MEAPADPLPLSPHARFHQQLPEIIAHGQLLISNAPKGRPPCCAWQVSQIRPPAAGSALRGRQLVLDVGGSHCKAALIDFEAQAEWGLLFDEQNAALLQSAPKRAVALDGFFEVLAARVGKLQVDGVALIWSNELEAFPLNSRFPGISGIGARIQGLASGSYQKDEWFIRGLYDGYDLSAALLSALNAQASQCTRLLIGNDSSFTLPACPGAVAAVVAASGANASSLAAAGTGSETIVNLELGAGLKLKPEWLCAADLQLAEELQCALSIEHLCAGLWLPRLVELHALARGLAVKTGSLSNPKLATLLASDPATLPAHEACLCAVSQDVLRRAGLCAALLAKLALPPQQHDQQLVALDSSLARHIPFYFAALQEGLSLVAPKAKICLLQPRAPRGHAGSESISVPMQGAARCLGAK